MSTQTAHIRQHPYGDLYIYYLEGRVRAADAFFGDQFMGNWEEDGHAFLFFSAPAEAVVHRLIEAEPHLNLLDRFQMSYDDWHGEPVAPFSVGRITVVPPWCDPSLYPGYRTESGAGPLQKSVQVVLDPGVVFGTGTHPTTHDCLEALNLVSRLKAPRTVLDIGTGTGLLALAAARLGSQKVLAVDLNRLATRTTRHNVTLNAMEERVLVVQGNAENFMDFPRDLVISNIHYDVMQRLVENPGFLAGGFFILSGLLRSQAERIEQVLKRIPVAIVKKWSAGGIWHTYLGHIV